MPIVRNVRQLKLRQLVSQVHLHVKVTTDPAKSNLFGPFQRWKRLAKSLHPWWGTIILIVMIANSRQQAPALVTFVTAGYPRKEDTVPILLAMQAGGANIIELGIPFSDPIADGPVIQESNTVCSHLKFL